MPESWESKLFRWKFKFFPAYLGTGATITYIAGDYRELKVKIPLSFITRNYVSTIYGGSMYAAVDPMYMLMLMRILGPNYVVWDKAATIRFRRPGTKTIYANFIVTDNDVEQIKLALETGGETDYYFHLNIIDEDGKIYADVDKTIYVATKEYYKQKLSSRKLK